MLENNKKHSSFLFDMIRGVAIGVAFIIPGFSGGSVAAILGIYEKLIGAIANLFRDFKNSLLTLLPIGLGMISGIIALLFPLRWALNAFPIPTVCLFVGLAIGGLPSITSKIEKRPTAKGIFFCTLALAVALSLSFLPIGSEVNLFDLDFGGYLLLFAVGIIGSAALVVPGISGSMLLLILGYYNPILSLVTEHLLKGRNILICVAALGTVTLGIACGFFLISILMKRLISKHPNATYLAILGFIVGSIPSIFASTAKDAGTSLVDLPSSVIYWVACAILLTIGIATSLTLIKLSKKQKNGILR